MVLNIIGVRTDCSKQMNFRCNMKKHITTHTGHIRCNCELCSKLINEKSNMKIYSVYSNFCAKIIFPVYLLSVFAMLRLYMSLATFFLRRTKIAKWTFVRPFPSMGPNMNIHGPSTFSCFGTQRATKIVRTKSNWFNHFTGVFANMSSHFMFGSGLFNSTLEGATKKWIGF